MDGSWKQENEADYQPYLPQVLAMNSQETSTS